MMTVLASPGKWAIRVEAIEDLLYFLIGVQWLSGIVLDFGSKGC